MMESQSLQLSGVRLNRNPSTGFPAKTFEGMISKGALPALTPDAKNGVKGICYLKDPDGHWIELF
ncbi:MAG TPA: hypothetical protein VED17_06255 [Nitrososphaerales archaeon]|nr:hypothetical protein [Nitrososphaerales archaeon]